MAERKTLQHVRSSALNADNTAKLPNEGFLKHGEIAVNFNAGHETLSIENSEGHLATFANEVAIGTETPVEGSPVEIFIDESLIEEEIEVYSKGQVENIRVSLQQTDAELTNKINEAVQRKNNGILVPTSLMVDELESPTFEVYTKAQVDALITKLKQDNNLI